MDHSAFDGSFPHLAGTWFAEVFNRSNLGVVQTDPFGHILYANPKAEEISGYSDLTTIGVRDLFPDEPNYEVLQKQLAIRRQGLGDEYEIEVTTSSGNKVPIRITSMPIISQDKVLGAVSILCSVELEKVKQSLYSEISSATSTRQLLEGITRCIAQVVPFDDLRATLYSRDTRHSRTVFQYPGSGYREAMHWRPISDAVRETVQTSTPSRHFIPDYRDQPSAKRLIEKGMKWSMRYPICRQGVIAGSIAILRRDPEFSDREFQIFSGLPLSDVLAAVLFFESREEMLFTLKLAKAINKCTDETQIFKLLAKALVSHYRWSHVSIFVPDEVKGELILRTEAVRLSKYSLPSGYKQPIGAGLLGYAYTKQRDACVSDVEGDPTFGSIVLHTPGTGIMRSELCMRIVAHRRTFALLNVEDDVLDAFSEEARETLRKLLDDLGDIIERRRRDSLVNATFDATPTAVFLIDDEGIIRDSNRAARHILDCKEEELTGKSISEFLADKRLWSIIAGTQEPVGEVELKCTGNQPIRGVLAGVPLKGTPGLRMLTFRDTRVQQKVEELGALTKVYSALAHEVKPELAIIGTTIRELQEIAALPATERMKAKFGLQTRLDLLLPSMLTQMLQYLRQLEATFDNVIQLGAGDNLPQPKPIAIYIPQFVADLLAELPITNKDTIKVDTPVERYVFADPSQLASVIQTIIGSMLRLRRRDTPIFFLVHDNSSYVSFKLTTTYSLRTVKAYANTSDLEMSRGIQDFLLGKPYVRRIIESHNGEYEDSLLDDGSFSVRFTMPAAGEVPK